MPYHIASLQIYLIIASDSICKFIIDWLQRTIKELEVFSQQSFAQYWYISEILIFVFGLKELYMHLVIKSLSQTLLYSYALFFSVKLLVNCIQSILIRF